jgi:hypothetical protein
MMYNNYNWNKMKKLVLILGLAMLFSAAAVNAQEKTQSKPVTHTTHTKGKKAPVKKGSGNYHMNKKSTASGKSMNTPMEDNSNVKSTGKPVY